MPPSPAKEKDSVDGEPSSCLQQLPPALMDSEMKRAGEAVTEGGGEDGQTPRGGEPGSEAERRVSAPAVPFFGSQPWI